MTEPITESFLSRTLRGARMLWRDMARLVEEPSFDPGLETGEKELENQFRECIEAAGGEVSARARAARLGEVYLGLNDDGRLKFLTLIAERFGVDRLAVGEAIAAFQASEKRDQLKAERALRESLKAPRLELLTQFNAIPQGVKFLVDMRADLLRLNPGDPALKALDADMQALLASWFDIGFLEMQRITWESPAALLEKLIAYESVHEIKSWDDLRNRLDADRRLYAFFHPRMPMEPLIFVEVALVNGIADNVQALLDEDAPILEAAQADTAIFYSISNTQTGLRGISFGNFLIKRVAEALSRDLPNLKTFCTLSPIPGFRRWLSDAVSKGTPHLLLAEHRKALKAATGGAFNKGEFIRLLEDPGWVEREELVEALKAPLMRLAARYLAEEKGRGQMPLDPVARFHLGNGAQIEQLDWLADLSAKGQKQSAGLMVNYLYNLSEVEKNHEGFARDGRVAMSSKLKELL